jgi:hypothetical protein
VSEPVTTEWIDCSCGLSCREPNAEFATDHAMAGHTVAFVSQVRKEYTLDDLVKLGMKA